VLETLTIRNFQTHKGLDLEFAPITTIVGASDRGKSAIIRSIVWAVFNNPSGSTFIKDGQKKCKVVLGVDGKKVSRVRSKSRNEYYLGDKLLEAFKTNVPQEVEKLLNVSDINFQNQHDAPFWFSETAGEVSRQLNQIIDLTAIDAILSSLASKNREAHANLRLVKERVTEAEEKVEELEHVKDMESDLTSLEEKGDKALSLREDVAQLRETVQNVQTYQEQLENEASALHSIKDTVSRGERWTVLRHRRDHLKSLTETIHKHKHSAERKIPDLSDLEDLFSKTKELSKRSLKLRTLLRYAGDLEEKIGWGRKEARKIRHQLEGMTCPLCGRSSS